MSRESNVGRFGRLAPWVFAVLGCGGPQAAPSSTPPPSPPPSSPKASTPPPANPVSPTADDLAAQPKSIPAIAALLADGFEERFAERAKVWVGANGRVRVDEPVPKPPESTAALDIRVVVERRLDPGDHPLLRVATDTAALRVALWLDEQNVARVLTRREVFAASARSTPPSRGPAGYPGLSVRVEEESGPRVRVSASYEFASPDSGLVTLSGWLNKEAVGVVYAPRSTAETAARGESSFVASATPILASIGGPVVATVTRGAGGVFFPVQVLGRHHGSAEIQLLSPELEVRGYVDQRTLQPLEPETPRGWGRAHFEAKLWRQWPKEQVRVESGTCIYDAPEGKIIGIVKRSHTANVVVRKGTPEYRAYRLPYEAVGYLHVTDLKPPADGQDRAEVPSLALEDWACPEPR